MAAFEVYFGKRNMISNMGKYESPLSQSYDFQSQLNVSLSRDKSGKSLTLLNN